MPSLRANWRTDGAARTGSRFDTAGARAPLLLRTSAGRDAAENFQRLWHRGLA